MEKNRKKTVVTVVGLAALLVTTGTFAWSAISQQALNEKDGQTEAGARVHDDYNKETGNKDIYAENYRTQNVIVRIKLSEYMENNGFPMVETSTKADKSTWTPYTLPGSKESEIYREYVTWGLGGSKTFLPTFNTVETNKSVAASGDAIDVLTNGATEPGTGKQDDFTAGVEYDHTGAVVTAGGTGKIAKETLNETKEPLSMADWLSLPAAEQHGNFWVVDEDGWAYWANLLAPGESTSLLLSQLDWNPNAVGDLDDWYYGIDVVGEFVTKSDSAQLSTSAYGAPTSSANQLLSGLTGIQVDEPTTIEVTSTKNEATTIVQGASRQFSAMVKNRSDIQWAIEPIRAGSIDATGKLTVNPDTAVGTELTVTASSGTSKGTKTVTVSELDPANWMSHLPDSTPLTQLSVPGTHDTMTYQGDFGIAESFVKTQTLSLAEQLESGVRYVDIRIDSDMSIHHGSYDLNAHLDSDVLAVLNQFLLDHPDETIFARMAWENTNDPTTFEANIAPILDNYPDLFYKNTSGNTLKDARSKVVVFDNTGGATSFASRGLYYDMWYNSSLIVQDNYSGPTIDEKQLSISGQFDAAIQRPDSDTSMYLNHISATMNGLSGKTPKSYAETLNPWSSGYINSLTNSKPIGIVIYDFVTSSEIDPVLTKNKSFFD